jgi:hypothetical protein
MSFRHRFARTISVVRARLYHQQFDYSWFREETRSFREAANVRWSPIAQHPTQECDLSFGFDLDSTTGYPSALYLRAITDGERTIDRGPNEYNESTFAAYGIRPIAGEISRRRGENSSVEINVEEGACTGRNYEVSSAQALLLNQYPTRIELTARSTYSEVWPFCNFATLGEVDIGSCQPLPTGQSLRDIRPDVWVIPPEKNQAAAQVD